MMKKIVTKDSSITFYNEQFQDYYHSVSGAIEEAIGKYVGPSNIAKISRKREKVVILDVCFGLGYNSLIAVHEINKLLNLINIKIIALENDLGILRKALKVDVFNHLKEDYDLFKIAIKRVLNEIKRNKNKRNKRIKNPYKIKIKNLEFDFYIGDALTEIKKIKEKADAVFFDPFAPKKCPELWTESFFKDIARIMNKGARLTTFSCAREARNNMQKAGFKAIDGPCIGRRAPSTIAILQCSREG